MGMLETWDISFGRISPSTYFYIIPFQLFDDPNVNIKEIQIERSVQHIAQRVMTSSPPDRFHIFAFWFSHFNKFMIVEYMYIWIDKETWYIRWIVLNNLMLILRESSNEMMKIVKLSPLRQILFSRSRINCTCSC